MPYDLHGRVVVVTGANSGIGRAASALLARAGATVVMACRSPARAAEALAYVKRGPDARVETMQLDLASQASIRAFAMNFMAKHTRLDVLIHNAAVFDVTQKHPVRTEDGVETVFATNHLGPFLLTHLLLDRLRESAPSRVITVASKGLVHHPFAKLDFDDLGSERRFSVPRAYYRSKLAQVMFTIELAERLRGTGVVAHCARVTNVAIPDERLANVPSWLRRVYSWKRRFAITPERQAETYLFLAADPRAAELTGGYWDEHAREVSVPRAARVAESRARLFSASAALTHCEPLPAAVHSSVAATDLSRLRNSSR